MLHLDETLGGISVIRIDRPPANAFDQAAIARLEETFCVLREQGPKGVILTGTGRMFSAGVDVRAFMGSATPERRAMVLGITRMTAALLALDMPVVAAVNGHALGGGFVLALCCDMRLCVADPAVKFGIPEAQAGVPFPSGPVQIIDAELPAPLRRRLALASQVLAPNALLEAGVLDGLVAEDALLDAAIETVERLAGQPAFATVKRQVRGPLRDTVATLARDGTEPFMDAFL